MGVLGKLAFWKKKENLDLGADFGADLGLGPQGASPDWGIPSGQPAGQQFGMPPTGMEQPMNLGLSEDVGFGNIGQQPQQPPRQPPGQPSQMQQPFGAPMQPPKPTERDYSSDKFEVVSAKLDAIRYTLDSINQRLANLERAAYSEHERKKW